MACPKSGLVPSTLKGLSQERLSHSCNVGVRLASRRARNAINRKQDEHRALDPVCERERAINAWMLADREHTHRCARPRARPRAHAHARYTHTPHARRTYARTHTYTDTDTNTDTNTDTHTHTHTRTHTHMHTHMHTHTHPPTHTCAHTGLFFSSERAHCRTVGEQILSSTSLLPNGAKRRRAVIRLALHLGT